MSGEQGICPTVRHSDRSNAKPTHKWTHSRLKPTKIKTVKKCPECILRGSSKPLLLVAGPLPSPAQKNVLQDDSREDCYQPSAQRAEMGPDLVSQMEKHPFTASLQGFCSSQPVILKQYTKPELACPGLQVPLIYSEGGQGNKGCRRCGEHA